MNWKVDMKATEKNPEIEALLTAITGKNRVSTIQAGDCTTCENPNINFTDALSEREYQISGMCQACQDSRFNL